MATYLQLFALHGNSSSESLKQQIAVAIAIKANAIAKLATPTTAQIAFSTAALANPQSYEQLIFNYIIAEYNTLVTTAITGASDANVQIAVNNAVDTLLGV